MGLETGTYVNDLNTANPTSPDPKSQGDDHLRLIKNVLLNSFAGFPGMVIVTGSEAQGATESDYDVTVAPAPAAYTASMLVVFKATHANAGAATVQVNALGTKPLLAVDGSALKAGDIESGGLAAAFYDGTSFYLVSGNDRADRNGDTYSGTHDFTGAVLRAATKAFGSAGNEVATVDYVNSAAFQAALPAQTGKNGQVISSDGTSASWTSGGTAGQFLQRSAGGAPVWADVIPPNIQRSTRTSNTMLVLADNQHLIDITSGTFAQTFDASANLGNGWFCYLRNSGSGDVTLDPNGSETIDGLSSFVVYPGEVRLVQCDGVALRSVVLNSFYKVFESSGDFIKPPGYRLFEGLLWGGGGSGRRWTVSATRQGGGGGGCAPLLFPSPTLASSVSFTIGAGGLGVTTDATNGNDGGNSVFNGVVAYGGRGGTDGYTTGGSAIYPSTAAFSDSPVTAPAPAVTVLRAFYGGGTPAYSFSLGANTVYGGAAGATVSPSSGVVTAQSVFGGAGGSNTTEGTSPTAGTAPGGGGAGSLNGTVSGAGARGELRIWGVI